MSIIDRAPLVDGVTAHDSRLTEAAMPEAYKMQRAAGAEKIVDL
jgi:hypothetical protein